MNIAELQFSHDAWQSGTIRLGAWYHSADVIPFDGGAEQNGTNRWYLTLDQWLWDEHGEEGQGLAGFLQLGFAPQDVNEFATYVGAGLTYAGLVPGRPADVCGIACNSVTRSDDLADAGTESVIELTYRAQLYRGVTLIPDYQYVINPGATDGDVDDAHVVAIRLETVLF